MMRPLAALSLALALVACGGSSPPPASPDNAPAPLTNPPAGAPDAPLLGPNAGGNAAAPSSSEADQGIDAIRKGDVAGAKAIYQRLHDRNPNDPDAFHLLGLIDEKQGDKQGAEKAYKDAIKARPEKSESYVDLSALLLDQQRYDDALQIARAGLSKSPGASALHTNAALALGGKGDVDGAQKEFDKAVKADPEDPMILFTYGHWLAAWKMRDPALAKLRAAMPVAKDDVGLLAAIGHELHAIGAFTDCIAAFDRAIGLKDVAELRTERASCRLGAKDAKGATDDLRAATQAQPSYAPAHFYLGRALADSGDWKGAVAEFEAFLKLDPNGPVAKSAREHLKKAKEHLK
jgi:tetratricopeptide (TPR) repeat protein